MQLLWLEFLHFSAAMLAILLSISAGSLFLITFRDERSTRTIWRSVGFLSMALAFFLLILERKVPSLSFASVIVEVFAFIAIYLGVQAEPALARLAEPNQRASLTGGGFRRWKELLSTKSIRPVLLSMLGIIVIIGAVYAASFLFSSLLPALTSTFALSLLELAAAVFIVLTIRIQIARYQTESQNPQVRRNNLYPLIAYVFLFFRALALIVYRLPDVDLVFIRTLGLEFGVAWIISVACALIGFVFLTLWAWHFIRVREFLRTYAAFLTIAIVVATASALTYSLFIFRIAEANNLRIMANGAATHMLNAEGRLDSAVLAARMLGNDTATIAGLRSGSIREVANRATAMFDISDADIIRIYNRGGAVFFSPSDVRDNGKSMSGDLFLERALQSRQAVRSFDVVPGVLSEQIAARAIYPVLSGGALLGAVEVGYLFDNAYLDSSKEKTGLDVTMYAGPRRSASTILTSDGVSRWVGTNETDDAVIQTVLGSDKPYETSLDRLGVSYYAAFAPVRNWDGVVIGMTSVGTPSDILLESLRQQLITTFLIAIVLSLIAAMFGYRAIQNFEKRG